VLDVGIDQTDEGRVGVPSSKSDRKRRSLRKRRKMIEPSL